MQFNIFSLYLLMFSRYTSRQISLMNHFYLQTPDQSGQLYKTLRYPSPLSPMSRIRNVLIISRGVERVTELAESCSILQNIIIYVRILRNLAESFFLQQIGLKVFQSCFYPFSFWIGVQKIIEIFQKPLYCQPNVNLVHRGTIQDFKKWIRTIEMLRRVGQMIMP